VPSFGERAAPELAEIRAKLEARLGPERAHRIATTSRNLGIFPNLVINDIMAITVRTFHPLAPGRMNVEAWSLAPRGEAPEHRKLRLENFLTFLGPGGFATPDDIEALESCHRGYAGTAEEWNDISATSPRPSRPSPASTRCACSGAAGRSCSPERHVARGGPPCRRPLASRARDRGLPLRGGRAAQSGGSTSGSRSSRTRDLQRALDGHPRGGSERHALPDR
jgi:hypothetical protein